MRALPAHRIVPAVAVASTIVAAIVVATTVATTVALTVSCSSPSAPEPDPVLPPEPAAPVVTAPSAVPPAAPGHVVPAPAGGVAAAPQQSAPRAGLRRNRAYDGAPPMIPHTDKDYAFDQCLECHGPGDGAGGDLVAAPTPHPELVHCRSCHVPLIEERTEFRPTVAESHTWPAADRAHGQAPWTIPHPVTMRERCVVCHTSPNLAEAHRTTHPERRVCTQCHVPADSASPGARPRGAWTGGPNGGLPPKDE